MLKKTFMVSVIMNAHNGEKYLRESLESLEKQTYKNWELIFFDNCSNDNTFKIFKQFKNKKFKYFYSKKKLKLYKARNLALKKAKGEFITFLDTDDKWQNNKLAKQVNFFRKNKKCEFLYSNYLVLDMNKNKVSKQYKFNLPEGMISKILLNNYVIAILTVMIRRKLFLKYKFNEKYEIIGDFDLFFEISKNHKISKIQEPLAYYRSHENNFSKKLNIYIGELYKWIKKNEKKLINSGYNLYSLKYYLIKMRIKKIISNFFN